MKKVAAIAAAALVAALVALGLTFSAETLPIGDTLDVSIPASRSPEALRIGAIDTGYLTSQAAFSFRGGSFSEERRFGMTAVLVDHPKGKLLIDTGFGRNVDEHFKSTNWLMRATSKYEKGTPAVDQLRSAGIDPKDLSGIIITHAHWDHVSGIEDLPGVPVWVNQAEHDFIKECGEHAALICSFGELPYKVYGFPDRRYLGFDSSFDFFGDGSVVIVPTPGHTPGSVAVFVNLQGGRRYAFIGDTAWQSEGVELPAERPWLPRTMLAEDGEKVRRWLAHFHKLEQAIPGMIVVPGHDQRVFDTLPPLQPGKS